MCALSTHHPSERGVRVVIYASKTVRKLVWFLVDINKLASHFIRIWEMQEFTCLMRVENKEILNSKRLVGCLELDRFHSGKHCHNAADPLSTEYLPPESKAACCGASSFVSMKIAKTSYYFEE